MIAMIFAAGKGTRLKPITDSVPKALVRVGGRSLLQIQIERLYSLGVRYIVVNVHHFSQQVVSFLHSFHLEGLTLEISDETPQLLNTGGGLRKAAALFRKSHPGEPVLIHNVDILDNADLPTLYNRCSKGVDVVVLVSERKTKRYLLFDAQNRMVGWTNIETGELKTPYENLNSDECRKLAFAGIHVVGPKTFDVMDAWPDEFSIIDFYVENCRRLHIHGAVMEGLKLMDVGKMETLNEAPAFLESLEKE